ncbi:MAG: metallopeptidase family protein [Gemmatimonadota bacterium]|nr:metallopeptidase family protein [Gemmatimonadota bacterium]
MTREQFELLVRTISDQVPAHYLEGVAAIDVSPRTVPHPIHTDVYTMGECIPFDTGTDEVLSRVVLYFGSFCALARHIDAFDWEHETEETLLHELRHHVEWRAGSDRLETYDWAVEQNLSRQNGEVFDTSFYHEGEALADDIWRVEDCIFIERVVRRPPDDVELTWRGTRYRVCIPQASLPLFITLDGLPDGPSGDVCLVLRTKPRFSDLFRKRRMATSGRGHVTRIR